MEMERVEMMADSFPEKGDTTSLKSHAKSPSRSFLSVPLLQEPSSISAVTSPFLQSFMLRRIEQLLNVASGLSEHFTDFVEQMLCIRSSLDTIVDTLRMCRHCLRRRRVLNVNPRLLVAGAPKSGKTTVFDFLFQGGASHVKGGKSIFSTVDFSFIAATKDDRSSGSSHSLKMSTSLTSERLPASAHENNSAGSINDSGAPSIKKMVSSRKWPAAVTAADKKIESCNVLLSQTPAMTDVLSGSTTTITTTTTTTVTNACRARSTRPEVNSSFDNGGAQSAGPPQPPSDPSRRRHHHHHTHHRRDDGQQRGAVSHKSAASSQPSERCVRLSVENETASSFFSSAPLRAAKIVLGKFDMTIVDYIKKKRESILMDKLRQKKEDKKRRISNVVSLLQKKPSNLASTQMESSLTFVTFKGLSSGEVSNDRATSWTLLESTSGVVQGKKEKKMSLCHFFNMISADAIFFTVPCDVVGTYRVEVYLQELFGFFATKAGDNFFCDFEKSERTLSPFHSERHLQQRRYSHGESDKEHRQNVRQLISDMTIFILTFSDAIIARNEGIVPLDEHLTSRPPPMASSLSELVSMFRKDMFRCFGVHVDPWQVIPFSGTMSRVTRDVLTALYETRTSQSDSAECGTSELPALFAASLYPGNNNNNNVNNNNNGSGSDNNTPNDASSVCQTLLTSYGGETYLLAAVDNYCDTVFGKRFNQRKESILTENLKEMVWQHAFTTMWKDSGACQLLQAAKFFEWSLLQNFLSRAAVSIVIWCGQVRSVIPQALEVIECRLAQCKDGLKNVNDEYSRVQSAVDKLNEEFCPIFSIHSIRLQLQERFEKFTIAFWWSLVDFFDAENKRCGFSCFSMRRFLLFKQTKQKRPSLLTTTTLSSSSSKVEDAKDRLRKQYQEFFHIYVETQYEVQFAQLKRIIEEGKNKHLEDNDSSHVHDNKKENKEDVIDMSETEKRANNVSSWPALFASNLLEDARHHIPFVEQNAESLKLTMNKELSLQLALLNTEIINYFMAELEVILPEFVEIADNKRDNVSMELQAVAAAIDFRESYDGVERKLLRLMLKELSSFKFLSMRPSEELRVFVTGLRKAVCQDQICLYAESKIKNKDKKSSVCPVETMDYLATSARESGLGQMQPLKFVQTFTSPVLREMQEREALLLAQLEMNDVVSLPSSWIFRCFSAAAEEKDLCSAASKVETAAETEKKEKSGKKKVSIVSNDDYAAEDHKEKKAEFFQNLFDDVNIREANPAWFLLVVWQNAFSAMMFSPWLRLQSLRYASLLHSISFILSKGSQRLDAFITNEGNELQSLMRFLQTEYSRMSVDIPFFLKRFGDAANSIAREVRCVKADTREVLS